MGGCSSKPKTAEFEVGTDLQEDKPQDEAPRKILEAENAGLKGIDREQESSERSIQTLLTAREQDDLRDMFAETEKQMIAGFSPDGNFKEERQVLEDDRQHVKQVLEETINDSGAEKDLSVKEEILKLQINPEVLASESLELHEDSVFIIEVSKELQETPLPAAIEADTQHKPLTLSKETLENEAKDVFSESNTLSLQDICISPIQDAPKLQVKPMCPQDGHLELSKDLAVGGEEILELQKEPIVSEDVDPGLQKDAPKEASKGRVESENHKAVYQNGEQRLDDSVGHEGQDKHFGEGTKECEELCKETEAGACELVNAASDGVLSLERGEDVLKDSSKPIWEVEIKGAAYEKAAEEFITGTCIDIKSPFAEASDQGPSRENGSTDAVYPAITADVSPNNLQHAVHEQAVVQEEQEVDVNAAASRSAESFTKLLSEPDSAPIEYKVAMKDVIPQADIHPVTDVLVKESSVETLDTTHGEGELNNNDKHLSPPTVVSEEPSHVQLLLENPVGEVQKEKSYAAVICIEGQRKSDTSSSPDEVTASQVNATTKKPEAESVHVMDFAELAFIPAQDIPAPDIDEVLEKLASEFERQERVARTTP